MTLNDILNFFEKTVMSCHVKLCHTDMSFTKFTIRDLDIGLKLNNLFKFDFKFQCL